MSNKIKHFPLSETERKLVMDSGHPVITFGLLTGLRSEELKRVFQEENKIDKNRSSIMIERKYSRGKKVEVFLSEKAVNLLDKYYCLDCKYFKYKNMSTNSWTKQLLREFKQIQIELNFEKYYQIHSLRATFATELLYNCGVNIVTVSTLMNHKSLDQTAEYIRVSANEAKDSVNMLANIDKYETFEGKNVSELKTELILLRKQNMKMEEKIKKLSIIDGGKEKNE